MARSGTSYTVSHELLRLVLNTVFLYLILAFKFKFIDFYSCHNLSFSGMDDGGCGGSDRWVWHKITIKDNVKDNVL